MVMVVGEMVVMVMGVMVIMMVEVIRMVVVTVSRVFETAMAAPGTGGTTLLNLMQADRHFLVRTALDPRYCRGCCICNFFLKCAPPQVCALFLAHSRSSTFL